MTETLDTLLDRAAALRELVDDIGVVEIQIHASGRVRALRQGDRKRTTLERRVPAEVFAALSAAIERLSAAEAAEASSVVADHGQLRWMRVRPPVSKSGEFLFALRVRSPRPRPRDLVHEGVLRRQALTHLEEALGAGQGVLIVAESREIGRRLLQALLTLLDPDAQTVVLEGEEELDTEGLEVLSLRRGHLPASGPAHQAMRQVISGADWAVVDGLLADDGEWLMRGAQAPGRTLATLHAGSPGEALAALSSPLPGRSGSAQALGLDLLVWLPCRDGESRVQGIYRLAEGRAAAAFEVVWGSEPSSAAPLASGVTLASSPAPPLEPVAAAPASTPVGRPSTEAEPSSARSRSEAAAPSRPRPSPTVEPEPARQPPPATSAAPTEPVAPPPAADRVPESPRASDVERRPRVPRHEDGSTRPEGRVERDDGNRSVPAVSSVESPRSPRPSLERPGRVDRTELSRSSRTGSESGRGASAAPATAEVESSSRREARAAVVPPALDRSAALVSRRVERTMIPDPVPRVVGEARSRPQVEAEPASESISAESESVAADARPRGRTTPTIQPIASDRLRPRLSAPEAPSVATSSLAPAPLQPMVASEEPSEPSEALDGSARLSRRLGRRPVRSYGAGGSRAEEGEAPEAVEVPPAQPSPPSRPVASRAEPLQRPAPLSNVSGLGVLPTAPAGAHDNLDAHTQEVRNVDSLMQRVKEYQDRKVLHRRSDGDARSAPEVPARAAAAAAEPTAEAVESPRAAQDSSGGADAGRASRRLPPSRMLDRSRLGTRSAMVAPLASPPPPVAPAAPGPPVASAEEDARGQARRRYSNIDRSFSSYRVLNRPETQEPPPVPEVESENKYEKYTTKDLSQEMQEASRMLKRDVSDLVTSILAERDKAEDDDDDPGGRAAAWAARRRAYGGRVPTNRNRVPDVEASPLMRRPRSDGRDPASEIKPIFNDDEETTTEFRASRGDRRLSARTLLGDDETTRERENPLRRRSYFPDEEG